MKNVTQVRGSYTITDDKGVGFRDAKPVAITALNPKGIIEPGETKELEFR